MVDDTSCWSREVNFIHLNFSVSLLNFIHFLKAVHRLCFHASNYFLRKANGLYVTRVAAKINTWRVKFTEKTRVIREFMHRCEVDLPPEIYTWLVFVHSWKPQDFSEMLFTVYVTLEMSEKFVRETRSGSPPFANLFLIVSRKRHAKFNPVNQPRQE